MDDAQHAVGEDIPDEVHRRPLLESLREYGRGLAGGLLFSLPLLTLGFSLARAEDTPQGPPGHQRAKGEPSHDAVRRARENALATHLALLTARSELSGSLRRMSVEFSELKTHESGIAGRHGGLFLPFVEQGLEQLRWLDAGLGATTGWLDTAAEVDDPEMRLALLRLGGQRLQVVLLGAPLLALWLDFLHLADVVLRECPTYNVEALFAKLCRVRELLDPSWVSLLSLEPSRVEAAAADLPALTTHLTGEFMATREAVRASVEQVEKWARVKELIEMFASTSAIGMTLPRLATTAPVPLGVGLTMSPSGVMMGTRVMVSSDWVEMMRRLVRAGVVSFPVVNATVRIHSTQVMMGRSDDELPPGVRAALGDGPEVRGMRVTDRVGAGMTEPPGHHVLPREFRDWFELRGFTGDMSIDRFCVRLEQANHQAIHGGGNWRLGRQWPGEWNQMLMKGLRKTETEIGRRLTRGEILQIVAERMKEYNLPMDFIAWTGR